ncbi:TetR family transcriptional regulator [Virgibacillus profundi]|uniref:TetR family transcriptional regulator n=1 Tax=Virgibacillus profundi TaxID=2024555 RepID=A0A2A2I8B6_9BACI|nr:TetR/AcrR family transcriptional regulator [Virgibacillus profundi]PAV28251.1 TetR family transcriptional regulator [Virgibacillus profundi]PXY52555.1 TetR/AcrR family transcriptional regulator [Virgibacillus profundi]
MNGFERRKEQKKRSILEAALALFMEFGVQKVSVAEIAKNAAVSQVTIYNYFESKDKLTDEVLKFYVDQVWDEQKAILCSNLPFDEKIRQITFEKSNLADQMSDNFFQDFMKDYSTGKSYVEDLYTNKALPLLIDLFNEGREQGFIDPSISNEAIIIYMQMFKEYMQRDGVAQDMLPLTEDLTRIFFYGIVGQVKK